ncbi:valine-pyruvate aminotransferase [Vibrio maritimus]|uniref:Valine-pyruvate aminotransferase n=1 Tax=Vibrio maritimus TaxID=990268 RepID=A0A090TFJ6_9VIBR|nr:valine-pyruvate aminotransferase [Vibrio maritimus]
MQFSKFGEKFNRYSGITQLMDDLNDGLRTPGAIMLGGGNPAAIPAMLEYFHQASSDLLASGELVAAMATTMVHKEKMRLLNRSLNCCAIPMAGTLPKKTSA